MKNKEIKVLPCPYCGDENPKVHDGYVRCQIFGCITYYHADTPIKKWNSKLYREGIQRALFILRAQGVIK